MKQLKIAQEEIERLKSDFKNKMAEASKREEVLRDENNFLKLPKAARRRKIDQDSRLKRRQIDTLKNVLHGHQGDQRRPMSLGSSYTSSPSTTASSTPRHVDFTPTKEFDILKSAPPRHTISWEKGFMTSNQDYFRRSQNQLQALQEILLDQQESICSEDSIPLVHTPQFRQISSDHSDNQSELRDTNPDDSNPGDRNLAEESSVVTSVTAEVEDISDASFQKRHAKQELRERNLVKSDKQHQLELFKRNIRNRKQTNKDNQNQLYSAINPEKIEVVNENEIPLTIFGTLLPKMSETDFRLPWLTTKEELNKERNSFPKRNAPKRRKT